MKTFLFLAAIGIIIVFSPGCKKDEIPRNGKVELHLLDDYSRIGNSFQIDESTIEIRTTPLIRYDDFLSYDSDNYTFEISDKAKESIVNMEHSVHGVAFALRANETIIYSGYFWPSYSSATCDWIVIDPVMTDNSIRVRLGYPGVLQGHEIPDRRNDSRIIEIFARDNKLKNRH